MNVWKSLGPSVGGCWEFLDHLLAVILKLLLAKIQKKKKTKPTTEIVWCRTCTLTMVLTCYAVEHVRIDLFLPEHPPPVL